ncbi:glycosyltransferase family 2 protein [Megalodesulfovibrio gigas]|nr:glycosyltransferase family 2 protein [Megalodesulfovibrio gigas]
MPPALHCIIVHYGSLDLTRECVRSLAQATGATGETGATGGGLDLVRPVVVCNSTPDEARTLAGLLGADLPGVRVGCWDDPARSSLDDAPAAVVVLCTGGNPGFAAACNVGLAEAARTGAPFAWLLNNDATAEPEAPARLLAWLQTHPRALAGTAVVRQDDPARLEMVLGCRYNRWTTKLHPVLPDALLAGVPADFRPQVEYVYGASMAFSMELYKEIGGLDEQFFLYYEEHDYCLRARQHGWSLEWAREVVVRHRGGASAGLRQPRSVARERSHYHENRSTLLFTRKQYPWALPVALAVRLAAKHVFLPLRGEAWLLPSLWAAVRDVLCSRAPHPGGPTS